MREAELKIDLPGGDGVTAIWSEVDKATWAFLYAPGAGSNLKDPFGAYAAGVLAESGIASLRFQFPYSEAGRPAPDRTPVLEATWRAAIEAAQPRVQRLIVGGRSMGGRIASQVVAAGVEVDALALFAYPLHPVGRPEQRRDAHLPRIQVPALFCSGDRDGFASAAELTELVAPLPLARLHLLPGADHSFLVLKASGRRREDVWREAVNELLAFITEIAS
jgi:predicted alpha/beta-hydrolase family hydrolase